MEGTTVIIGAGEIGSALGRLAAGRVVLWDIAPDRGTDHRPLADVVREASLVALCVPSWNMVDALASVRNVLPEGTPLLSLAKGLCPDGRTMVQLAQDTLPTGHPFGILAGPLLAEELNRGLGGVGVVATSSEAVAYRVRQVWGDAFTLHVDADLSGVAYASVLKNVYALGIGIAAGLSWGANKTGAIYVHATAELLALGELLGGSSRTLLGPAGIGDLFATGTSAYSRNHAIGEALAAGRAPDAQSEGMASLEPLRTLIGDRAGAVPLLDAITAVAHGASAAEIFPALLSTPSAIRADTA